MSVYEPKNDMERAALIAAGGFTREKGWKFIGMNFSDDHATVDLKSPSGEFVYLRVRNHQLEGMQSVLPELNMATFHKPPSTFGLVVSVATLVVLAAMWLML